MVQKDCDFYKTLEGVDIDKEISRLEKVSKINRDLEIEANQIIPALKALKGSSRSKEKIAANIASRTRLIEEKISELEKIVRLDDSLSVKKGIGDYNGAKDYEVDNDKAVIEFDYGGREERYNLTEDGFVYSTNKNIFPFLKVDVLDGKYVASIVNTSKLQAKGVISDRFFQENEEMIYGCVSDKIKIDKGSSYYLYTNKALKYNLSGKLEYKRELLFIFKIV
jgi:hypothetical protein